MISGWFVCLAIAVGTTKAENKSHQVSFISLLKISSNFQKKSKEEGLKNFFLFQLTFSPVSLSRLIVQIMAEKTALHNIVYYLFIYSYF